MSARSAEWRSNVSKWNGDGVIAAIKDERTAEVLSSLHLPVIGVGAAGADDPAGAIPRVCSDNRKIARLAEARRLIGTTPALYRRLERGRFRDALPAKE